nr:unnamed protein product [Callosobruchus analis]
MAASRVGTMSVRSSVQRLDGSFTILPQERLMEILNRLMPDDLEETDTPYQSELRSEVRDLWRSTERAVGPTVEFEQEDLDYSVSSMKPGLIKKEGRTTLFGQEIVPQEYRYACVLTRHMEDLVMREWQLTWSASGKGRYCRELIPNVRVWCEQGDFPITRRCAIFLSSHAELGVHLHRVGKSDSPMCEACGVVDSPSHRITSCVNFRQIQTGLLAKAGLDGNNFTADEIVLALGHRSSAWVNGVSVRSNFTQTILDHEKSQQHISASLSYNNWLQANTIDTLLKSEIDSKITFWRDVLHRIINVIITLVSCNLPLRGHVSDSGNFMAISRLLSNYDATLNKLLLKPKGEINYLSPAIQNEIISLLGTTVRNNIISEIKKAPFLTIILDKTQDLSKIDQLSVVFRYISVRENDDNVPKEIKICESFLGFITVTDFVDNRYNNQEHRY